MQFTKAERKKAKLRLALTGPSGSGKTYGALLIAKGIGGKIAVVDTEKGSASLYSHLVDFDTLDLAPPYSPERFIEAVKAAEKAGYDILVIDSITHEWSGAGGCLEINDELAKAKFKGNTWSAWNAVTPRHRAFLDTLLHSQMHIIATMRSKTETAQTEENGKKKVVKLGMKAEQREGAEYEFTTVLDLVHDGHYAVASKDRTGLFMDTTPQALTVGTGETLKAWLETGVEATQQPQPQQSETSPPTGPHTATDGALEGLDDDKVATAQHAAMDILNHWESGNEIAAYEVFYESNFENDTKVAIWGLLKPHSKLRSRLKAMRDADQQTTKEAA